MERTPPKITREPALDRLRALCVISMLLGHLAPLSFASRLAHVPLWVDGAMGFVLVSGVVFGIVRRSADRAGADMGHMTRASWTRAGELWIISIAIALFGFALGGIPGSSASTPSIDAVGSFAGALSQVATIQVTTKYVDVLIVYVWFLLLAPGILWLLRRERYGTALAAGAALAVYLFDVARAPGAFRMTEMSITASEVIAVDNLRPLRWFFMFVVGMIGGWHWPTVQRFFSSTRNRMYFVSAGVACVLVAQGVHRTSTEVPVWLVDKGTLGPLAVIAALVVYGATFSVLISISTHGNVVLRNVQEQLGRLGMKSLAAYVIHIVVVYVATVTIGVDGHPAVGVSLIAVTVGLTLWWEAHSRQNKPSVGPFSKLRTLSESPVQSNPLPQPTRATF